MQCVTDRPDATSPLLPPGVGSAAWRRASAVDAGTMALWSALGKGDPPWTLDVPEPPAASSWSRVVFLSYAPISPFDVLKGRLASCVHDVGPMACVALAGRGFHGHSGRPWVTAPSNLHLSVALPVHLPAVTHSASLSMLPAVAVIDAIARATRGELRPGIKWVSDILVDEGKVAGVLTATRVLRGVIDFAVIGVGINVSTTPPVAPTPFVPVVGCLQQHFGGRDLTLGSTLWDVLAALSTRLSRLHAEGPASLEGDYRRASVVIGRRVRIWEDGATSDVALDRWPPPLARGLVVDIGPDLALSLAGRPEPVDRGRLALEDACGRFGL